MKVIGIVAAEGGPLLIMDAKIAYHWGGIDTLDYDRACDLFDKNEKTQGVKIEICDTHGLLWELNGPGLAYIINNGSKICLIRAWIGEDIDEREAALDFAKYNISHDATHIGTVTVNSKKMAIIWATENGDAIKSALDLGVPRNNKKTSIDDSSIVFDVDGLSYDGFCDTINGKYGIARRLFLI